MDKKFLKTYIDNALACESELCRIQKRLKGEIRNFIRSYNVENGKKADEVINFEENEDIFYDFYRGDNLVVSGVKVEADGEILLYLPYNDVFCGLDDDGETNMEELVEALNSLIDED